jgi:hypothetical protein
LSIYSDDNLTRALLKQGLALARRDRQTTLRIHIDVLHTTEHCLLAPLLQLLPQKARISHKSPLGDTIGPAKSPSQARELKKACYFRGLEA